MTKPTLRQYAIDAAHKYGLDPRDDFQAGLAIGIELSWLSATEAGQGQRHDYAVPSAAADAVQALRAKVKAAGLGDLDAEAWKHASNPQEMPRLSYPAWARVLAGKSLAALEQTTATERGVTDQQAKEIVRTSDDPKVKMLWTLYNTPATEGQANG